VPSRANRITLRPRFLESRWRVTHRWRRCEQGDSLRSADSATAAGQHPRGLHESVQAVRIPQLAEAETPTCPIEVLGISPCSMALDRARDTHPPSEAPVHGQTEAAGLCSAGPPRAKSA